MTLDLDALKAALAAATPGPWEQDQHKALRGVLRAGPLRQYSNGSAREQLGSINALDASPDADGDPAEMLRRRDADATLIVLLRNAAPELIAEVERLRAHAREWATDREILTAHAHGRHCGWSGCGVCPDREFNEAERRKELERLRAAVEAADALAEHHGAAHGWCPVADRYRAARGAK